MAPALESFAGAREALIARGGAYASLVRSAAWNHFVTAGLPQGKNEEWKYTPATALWARSFVPAPAVRMDALETWALPRALPHATRLTFVNGHFEPLQSSALPVKGAWVRVTSSLPADGEASGTLAALNSALFEEAAVLEVEDGVDAGTVEIVHVMHHAPDGAMAHPRIRVRLGKRARLTLVETYLCRGAGEYLVNAATDAVLGRASMLTHVTVQQDGDKAAHLGAMRVTQEEDSRFRAHLFQLGGALARRELSLKLAGRGASAELSGLFLPRASQHHDQHIFVDHAAPECTSRQDFRGVAQEKGRGVFTGQVRVQPHAQKSDAAQTARALLLSPDAEVDLRPHLEIHADDVKATHGATVGELDSEQIFYLRSRGIPETEARALLLGAFAAQALDAVEVPGLRERLETVVKERL